MTWRLSSLPRSFGRVSRWWRTTLGEWLARWRRIGRPKGAQEGKGREGKGKGWHDDCSCPNICMKHHETFRFLSGFKFLFLYLFIYIYVCLFMMTNDRSLSVYLILEVEWLWPMCRTRAGWNVGFFYWDQFADEVSGSGQLGCLVRSSSSRSLAWSWIFESFDHDLQLYIMIYDDLWWSMIVFTSLVRTAAVRNAPVMRNRNSGPGS